ncbi:hypothetical protein [Alteromonas sp. BMJM2]|uniref:hypothetical protein n=1 Tax=Alteromonas sp. BMJM2 TaxID=2954241 RepID=UPI0022B2F952|nr:hypothetical protein [Alteromonas sp. BMJM2]
MSMAMFCHPLHGVVCRPWSNSTPLRYELELTESNNFVPQGPVIWEGRQDEKRFNTNLKLHKNNNEYSLAINCQGSGVFKLNNNKFEISWRSEGTQASHYFQSMGLALWLELQGVICLHGNALTKNNRTIVLLAPSGTGKSTLSSWLMQQGYQLMSDDMVALHKTEKGNGYRLFPSWPVMRLWPDSINTTLNSNEQHEKVHANFDKKVISVQPNNENFKSKLLTDIIILNRQDTPKTKNKNNIDVRSLNGSAAVMALLKNTILGEVYRPLNIEAERLTGLAQVAQKVQISELTYPSGIQGLQAIAGWLDK